MLTQEQWIVYLYSIWPDGGFSIIYLISLIGIIIYFLILNYDSDLYNSNNPNDRWYKGNSPRGKYSRFFKVVPVILILLLVSSNFIPDKKGFLMLIATPYLVDGSKAIIDSEKASKFSEIIDLSLDKAISELRPKEQGK